MTVNIREEILLEAEGKRTRDAEPELEKDLSINDWIARIRGGAQTAHSAARTGALAVEYDAWLDIMVIALGRLERIVQIQTEG